LCTGIQEISCFLTFSTVLTKAHWTNTLSRQKVFTVMKNTKKSARPILMLFRLYLLQIWTRLSVVLTDIFISVDTCWDIILKYAMTVFFHTTVLILLPCYLMLYKPCIWKLSMYCTTQ
jgi:hypothetical protein